jgi:adenosylcobinamide amidohydrolase
MKGLKKWVALATAAAMMTSSSHLAAQPVEEFYTAGDGYTEYRTTPSLAPAIALGAIALAAIIAVALQNSSNNHGHSH